MRLHHRPVKWVFSQAACRAQASITRLWLRTRKGLVLVSLVLASCSPLRGCVESQFTLAPDSPLPQWFALPAGHSRSEVTVRLTYYVPLLPVDNAVLELVGRNGNTLATLTGEVCWHPVMKQQRNQYGGLDPGSEPHYVYLRANGIIEVLEHPRGSIFRITDDPILVKAAREAKRCDKG